MRRHNIFITLLSFVIILDSIDIQHVKASLIEDATLSTLQQQDPSNKDIMDNIEDLEIDINNDPTVSPPKHQGHWGTKSTNAKNGNNNASVNGNANGSGNSNGHGEHIPFVPHHKNKGNDTITHQQHQHAQHQPSYHQNQSIQYTPPDSFTITAKITSNSEFANTESSASTSTSTSSASASAITSSLPSIPFMECNNIGTTTQSILNQASFRHFPKSGAHPTTYTKTNGMIIPLSAQVEIQVRGSSNGNSNSNGNGNGGNSNTVSANDNGSVNNNDKKSNTSNNSNNNNDNKEGEIRTFKRGDVIWVDGGEYKMTSAKGCDDDLSVLILNIDKKNNENKNIFRNSKYNPSNPTKISCSMMDFSYGTYSFLDEQDEVSLGMAFVQNIVKIPMRKVLLSSIGLSLSSLVTYFLSKVAPLQLAVGIGGACVISGGTYAVVSGGEWLCEEIEKIWDDSRSRKRRSEMGVIDDEDEDDDDNSLDNADLDSSENDTSDTTVEEIAIVVEESLTI
jgi:hypothetical protein